MRIAFVDTTLEHPPTGGCQTFLVSLTTALRAAGAEVHVVYEEGRDRSITDRLAAAGVSLHADLWARWCVPEDRADRVAQWARDRRLDAFVVSVSPDVGWLALPLLDPAAVTVAIVHLDGPAFYKPLSHYAPFVDRAVGVSEATHQRVVADCGIPPERAYHIPYGVEPAPLSQVVRRWDAAEPLRPLRLGYVGRLDQSQKRIRDLPHLLAELTARGLPFAMEVIGTGEEAQWLRQEVSRASFASCVSLLGWLEPQEVRERLLSLDVLLLFSNAEGLPLALLEAMGHAVVPVVTRIASGNTEVLRDGQNGYLVPVGDIRAFADRLQGLAGDRSTLRRLSKAAWETGQRYSVERMTASYVAALGVRSPSGGIVRAPRPEGRFPLMASCRSPHPRWLRRVKWAILGRRAVAVRANVG